MLFRDAEFADWEAIGDLHALSWRIAYQGILSRDFLDNFAQDDRRLMWRGRLSRPEPETRLVRVAVRHAQIVGFVCVLLDQDERWGAVVDNVHVHPELKGRGVGRELLAQAASWVIDQRPMSSVHLWVYEDNRPARGFYERLGGVAVERVLNRAPDGNDVAVVRYVWEDPGALVPLVRSVRISEDEPG